MYKIFQMSTGYYLLLYLGIITGLLSLVIFLFMPNYSQTQTVYNNLTELEFRAFGIHESNRELNNTYLMNDSITLYQEHDLRFNTLKSPLLVSVLQSQSTNLYSHEAPHIIEDIILENNEIAIPNTLSKNNNLAIGDTLYIRIDHETKQLIIHSIYNDYGNFVNYDQRLQRDSVFISNDINITNDNNQYITFFNDSDYSYQNIIYRQDQLEVLEKNLLTQNTFMLLFIGTIVVIALSVFYKSHYYHMLHLEKSGAKIYTIWSIVMYLVKIVFLPIGGLLIINIFLFGTIPINQHIIIMTLIIAMIYFVTMQYLIRSETIYG